MLKVELPKSMVLAVPHYAEPMNDDEMTARVERVAERFRARARGIVADRRDLYALLLTAERAAVAEEVMDAVARWMLGMTTDEEFHVEARAAYESGVSAPSGPG